MLNNPENIIIISADIENTGDRAGEEVVQLYIRDMVASRARPMKELKGFKKIMLLPGEKKTVEFTVKNSDLAFYNWNMEKVTEPGKFMVSVSKSSSEHMLMDFFEVV